MPMITSAQVAKELKKLNDQHDALIRKEEKASVFTAAIQEDIETVRPEYDYDSVQKELADVERKIRALKHAVNQFNLTQVVPEFGMTIDQMLIYIPQLTARKRKLDAMRARLPKERVNPDYGRPTAIIEYHYSNYDIQKAEADYDQVTDELARAQNALDSVNATVLFEVEE